MTCDHTMRSGEFCGRPKGRGGNHYRPETVQREAERMRLRRTTQGPWTMKGCEAPRMRYPNSDKYDVRCLVCKYEEGIRYRAKQRLVWLEKEFGLTAGDLPPIAVMVKMPPAFTAFAAYASARLAGMR